MGKFNFKGILGKLRIKKNYILIIIGVLLIGLILARTMGTIHRVLFKRKPKEAAELEMIGEAIPVKVYKVRKMSFKDTLPAMGTMGAATRCTGASSRP